ncbi:MAG: hypothetical protein INR66_03650 [Gordonia polyisoprenivorans]|nr:hypothetical protein [Gordonia polyisoprenivorans]
MGNDELARGTQSLVSSAQSRVAEALSAWIGGDFDRAASSAPLALELLAKAALWSVSPTLLLPLEKNQEASLVALATSPNLGSPTLRTIGLKIALSRLIKVHGDLPVPETRHARLVDCRNGALHVGTLPQAGENSAETTARLVLADSLLLCTFMLGHLNRDPDEFYGDKKPTVDAVLAERRTEVEHRVSRLLTQAADKIAALQAHVDSDTIWISTAHELEAAAEGTFIPEQFSDDMGAIAQTCPTCGYQGRLLGRVSVDSEVDWEYEDGQAVAYGYWVVTFHPRAFGCNVCKLILREPAELTAAKVPTESRSVDEDDLGESFSVSDWVEAEYGAFD